MTLPISKYKIGTIVRTMEEINLYTGKKGAGPSQTVPSYCLGSVTYKSEGNLGIVWIWTTKEGLHKWVCIEVRPEHNMIIEREI